MQNHRREVILTLLSTLFAVSCAKTEVANVYLYESVSEIAGAVIAGAVNGSMSNGSRAEFKHSKSYFSFLKLFGINEAVASATCTKLTSSSSCIGSSVTLTYPGCSFDSSQTVWKGAEILSWTTSSCPSTAPSTAFTRVFASGTSRLAINGVSVAISTSDSSGWSNTNEGGGTIVNWSSPLTRTLNVSGIHLIGTTAAGGSSPVWDYTLNTSTALTVSSSVIPAGTINIQDNLNQYTAVASIVNPLVFNSSCCHPVGGEIDSTLSDSRSGVEKLVYTPTCGQATFTSSYSGAFNRAITLNHCF